MFSIPLPRSAPLPSAVRRSLAAALLIALAPVAVGAATIVVTSPDDSDPGAAGTCTLRQAIVSMNTGALAGSCANSGAAFGSDDAIRFAASALADAATPGTIALADSADSSGAIGGTLVISSEALTIDGSAWRGDGAGQYADGVTIARPDGASNPFGIFKSTASAGGRLALNGLAIRNGRILAGGGGISVAAANLSMTDSTISGNVANDGGGIWSPAGTLTLTRCTIEHNLAYRGGGLYAGTGSVTVSASAIRDNGEWGGSHGGGIHAGGPLAVIDSAISGNVGKRGAGIQSGGALTLTRSVVAGNDSYYHGGGIHVLAGGSATVTASTISGNHARYLGGGVYSEGVLTVADSTIAGNGSRDGGGVFLAATATLHLDQATLSQNGAGASGGGVGSAAGASGATIDRSIVSNNTQGTGSDVHLDAGWTGTGNLISNTNVALGALQDNGGPTPTMLPAPGSAAIDARPPQDCAASYDQRGIARPQGAGCDVGAVEVVVDAIFTDGFDGFDGG